MISRIALAASLALAVAACGSNKEPSDESTGAAAAPSEAASAAPAALASAAAPSDTPSVSPSATPTAKATEEHKDEDKDKGKGKDKDSDDHADQPAGPPQAFNQCAACHSTTPGKTIIGPSLAHVYGRKAGSLAGFQYSDAMKGSGLTWTSSNLDAFLTNPAGKVPGTLMGLAGIKDAAQRKAIVDYLKTL